MTTTVALMVSKIDGLINVLLNDQEVAKLQAWLEGKLRKIDKNWRSQKNPTFLKTLTY